MKSKTARSLRRPLCNRGFGHETRHQQRHTQPQCSFSLTGLYIYPLPTPPPLLSTSLLYYHPLSWTPLSLHIHTLLSTSPLYNHQLSWTPYFPTFLPYCPPPPYTTTNSAGHPTLPRSYLTVHLPPIQPPTQLDTMSSYFPTSLSPHQVPQRPPNRSLNAQLVAPGAPPLCVTAACAYFKRLF